MKKRFLLGATALACGYLSISAPLNAAVTEDGLLQTQAAPAADAGVFLLADNDGGHSGKDHDSRGDDSNDDDDHDRGRNDDSHDDDDDGNGSGSDNGSDDDSSGSDGDFQQ